MGPAESVGMGPDVTTARWRVVTVVGAVVLAGVGWLLALSYNGAGALLIALALLLVAVSFPGARLPIGLALSSAVCAFAAWATLGGGASSWTAAPWVVGALILAAAAVVAGRGGSSGQMMFVRFADRVLVLFGGRARFAPRRMVRQHAAEGRPALVVVAHFPNRGYATAIHPRWEDIPVSVNGADVARLLRSNRHRVHVHTVEPGVCSVRCGTVSPALSAQFELGEREAALVEITPAPAASERAAELAVTVFGSAGKAVRQVDGSYLPAGGR